MDPDQPAVDKLNLVLGLYRSLMLRMVVIVVVGFVAAFLLARLGTALSPPYGVRVFGEDLGTWGLIGMLALFVAEYWWKGRQIARILNSPPFEPSPYIGVLSGLGVVAQRAHAMGMRWTGFLGPLQPVRDGRARR